MKIFDKIFIALLALIFVALVVVFNFLPRSTFSEVERRELKDFPTFAVEKLSDGSFAQEFSEWYSDTEPFRDEFMTANMLIKGALNLNLPMSDSGEALAFHAADGHSAEEDAMTEAQDAANDSINPYVNRINADEENAKMAHSGILVVGTAPNARALMAYGASGKAGTEFAELMNHYHEAFDGKVHIYCMVIPNAIEFYCPDKAKNITKPQIATINNIYQHLAPGVKGVDCYTPLSKHVEEDIFLRTDHHWAPLGAYYAAEAFAKDAGVPFADLSTYEQHVIHDFVGTMYGYSKDIAIKQSPEDFVYYTPTGVDYTTTFTVYNLDKHMNIISEDKPHQGEFFAKFKDGSGMAYMTFMGGDQKYTQVKTNAGTGRRLLILKDSFGNALPGYLFHSFDEIHVVDFRYFTHNLKKYVSDHGITDILFAHSIFMCLGNKPLTNYKRFLTQEDGAIKPKPQESPKTTAPADSTKQKTDKSTKAEEPTKAEKTDTPTPKPQTELPETDVPPVKTPVEAPAGSPEPVDDPLPVHEL